MKVTTKKISDTRAELKVVLEKSDLAEAIQKATERLAKEVKVQGFRKGKAPVDLAAKEIPANALSDTALDIAIRDSVPHVFEEAKLTPVQQPHLDVTKYVPGETVEYTTIVDVLPEIKLGDYKNLGVKKEKVTVPAKDVNEVLDNIANAYAEKKVAQRPAKDGDEVIIDFEGKKDDVAFDGGTAKDYALKLGSGQFIPGFEEGIVGHSVGDRFDLNLTFPKEYHVKDLAGAKVVFSVLLKQVNEIIVPKLDDELAQKCGPFKTLDELKADIKKNLAAQNEHKAEEKYKDDLVQALVKKSKVAAPEVMVEDQFNFIKEDVTRNAASRGLTFEQVLEQTGQSREDWEKDARKAAEQRVKASLVLQTLAAEQKVTIKKEDVDAKIAELKDVYKNDKNAIKQLDDPKVKQDIANRLMVEATLDILVKANK